ncbi:MAG: peptidoglycan editing factor PgeF, partial [Chloroflexi bacterium]|nr:peptidoglycan editing factor PgeF [Chloroflexota bacterium]
MWPDLTHGVFTRHGGVSAAPWQSLNLGGNVGDDPRAVRSNHERMYAALGVADARACTVWQIHSTDVIVANGPVQGRRWLAHADALITDRADTPLSMRFADCVPLLFRDPVRGVIGMAHAGWRGTVAGMAAQMVGALAETYGSRPTDLQVGIGPSIGPARYQVGEEVVEAARAYFGSTDEIVRRDPSDGTAYLDLWRANQLDLEQSGVGQIEIARICTAERTDEFYSHRAEQGRTGRFGAVVAL